MYWFLGQSLFKQGPKTLPNCWTIQLKHENNFMFSEAETNISSETNID